MTTPSNGQMSNESATRNGIQALEMAYNGVTRCQQDVSDTRNRLPLAIDGDEGNKFLQLLDQWNEQCTVILTSLDDMVTELNHTLTSKGLTQGSNVAAVDTQFQQSDAIFDTLSG